jgi:hypothetical protein
MVCVCVCACVEEMKRNFVHLMYVTSSLHKVNQPLHIQSVQRNNCGAFTSLCVMSLTKDHNILVS